MPPPRKPTVFDWSLSAVFLLLGVGVLAVHSFAPGPTPEDELSLAEGVPTAVDLKQSADRGGPRGRI